MCIDVRPVTIFRLAADCRLALTQCTSLSGRKQYIWVETNKICFATMAVVLDQGLFFVS